MSTTPEPELDLELHFLPAWAKQSPDVNRYANYDARDSRARRGDRGRQEEGGRPGERREGGPRPGRRQGPGGGERAGGAPRRFGGSGGEGRAGMRPGRREPLREPEVPLPELQVTFTPDEKGVESLARQIKFTGRAYPVFEIAHLILRKADRYQVTLGVVKREDGQVAQALWQCGVDETLWFSQDEAVQHVLRKHFDLFYQAEKTPTEPPKGTYTFVAQCGLSGVILGPPNFHDYQTKLRKLHAGRFSRLPFEAYKAKIRIVRDEETVKKWVEDQSWKTEYVCLNVPEALKLPNREAVEKHFREVHAANLIRQIESWTGSGVAAQQQPLPVLRQVLRRAWEEQERFPLRVVTVLSQQFAGHGLQFFKVNKTITHVSVARPHYLDLEAAPVSEGVRRIVEFIQAHSGCTRRQLLGALAPGGAAPSLPAPVAVGPVVESAGAEASATGAATGVPESEPPAPAAELQPSAEQTAIIADLHWLIHQGHVIEFANGRLETARKPSPKPLPRPAVKGSVTGGVPAATGTAPQGISAPVEAEARAAEGAVDASSSVMPEAPEGSGDEGTSVGTSAGPLDVEPAAAADAASPSPAPAEIPAAQEGASERPDGSPAEAKP